MKRGRKTFSEWLFTYIRVIIMALVVAIIGIVVLVIAI